MEAMAARVSSSSSASVLPSHMRRPMGLLMLVMLEAGALMPAADLRERPEGGAAKASACASFRWPDCELVRLRKGRKGPLVPVEGDPRRGRDCLGRYTRVLGGCPGRVAATRDGFARPCSAAALQRRDTCLCDGDGENHKGTEHFFA